MSTTLTYKRVKVQVAKPELEFWPAEARFQIERAVSATGARAGIPFGVRLHCWVDGLDENRMPPSAAMDLFQNLTRAGGPLDIGVFFYSAEETEDDLLVEFRGLLSRWEYSTATDSPPVRGDVDERHSEGPPRSVAATSNLLLHLEFTGVVDPEGLDHIALHLGYGG